MVKLTRPLRGREAGFSLVELMVVVGIIGVLATLAVPRFQQFQAKARMAEAKTMLSHIFTLEESYHLDNNRYLAFAGVYGRTTGGTLNCTRPQGAIDIGFDINPCAGAVPRFGYNVPAAANATFTARAATGAGQNNLVCPGGAATVYTMNEGRRLMGATAGSAAPSSCN